MKLLTEAMSHCLCGLVVKGAVHRLNIHLIMNERAWQLGLCHPGLGTGGGKEEDDLLSGHSTHTLLWCSRGVGNSHARVALVWSVR